MTVEALRSTGKPTGSSTERTRRALIAAGISLFSQKGYDATSTRQIEAEAQVQRNLMTYHFGSKEQFWKACMTELNERMANQMEPVLAQSRDIATGERIRFMIRRFVRASAAVPEVGRIMFDEGRHASWRLEWLVENYAEGFFGAVGALFDEGRAAGIVADIPKLNFYYMVVGSASIFSMSAECTLLTGKDAFDPAMIDVHADAVATLIAPRL